MADPERPSLAGWRAELAQLSADAQEMITLRWQLARLEFTAGLDQLKRLAKALAIALVLGMTAPPLVAVCVAQLFDGRLGLPWTAWLLLFAATLLGLGSLIAWLAWRGFRRRFGGLEESLEELREDLLWLREWTHSQKAEVGRPKAEGESGNRKAESGTEEPEPNH